MHAFQPEMILEWIFRPNGGYYTGYIPVLMKQYTFLNMFVECLFLGNLLTPRTHIIYCTTASDKMQSVRVSRDVDNLNVVALLSL